MTTSSSWKFFFSLLQLVVMTKILKQSVMFQVVPKFLMQKPS